MIFQNESIEIDETYLYKIRKGLHGNLAKLKIWIFGVVSRSTGFAVYYLIEKRNRSTLLKLLKKHVSPGCVLYRDCWSAYINTRVFPPRSHLTML